jgi:ankyrin repeat protein
VNATNNVGNTALHYAMQRGSAPMIQALTDAGARNDIKNKQGKTAADLARK